jgi:PKD repeat protein
VPDTTPIAGFLGISVNLTDTSNAAGGNYFWDFGGGRDLAGNLTSTSPVSTYALF